MIEQFSLVFCFYYLLNVYFQMDDLLLSLSSSIVYSLVCVSGSNLDFEKLGCMPYVADLAQFCLKESPPSQLFWGEEGI